MLCLVNLANIFMLYYGDVVTAGSLAWVASAISVTMVSRLILNLHDATSGDVIVSTVGTGQQMGLFSFPHDCEGTSSRDSESVDVLLIV
ncbi:hypothetical protein C8R45DRAFT_971378 [Mycena sanguinolenta]|nr:hypothetical protein C8R45DRAFT_971378 [Mycena sanguinolenta]